MVKLPAPLLTRPADYKIKPDTVIKPDISIEKYSDNIHFVLLKHTDGRAMIVEFADFLVVTEAPLNSENGELIIQEARKIAPGKPIKYFLFSHFHPDYTGGMRSFVHAGATVLCCSTDVPYVTYLAAAPHSLQPDNLEREPVALKTEEINDTKVITDGKYTMNIYFMGDKSEHTNDYLLYYFPKEKMLFEGDLAFISKEGPPQKASKRQAGLYNAIKEIGIDVQTVSQSWPAENYGVKWQFPFAELEQSVNVK
jgi:glyoxylase-like metal-dependent hydrolase (beta-lactamase superfamily II)